MRLLQIAVACMLLAIRLSAQLIEQKPAAYPVYAELPGWLQGLVAADEYNALASDSRYDLQRIAYRSDGLRVYAYLHQAHETGGRRLPVVIYCRGGIGADAKIGAGSAFNFIEMRAYAAAGFLVVAPQFRGADGGEGRDEVGGAEVNDVLNLLPVVEALPSADANQLFICGSSRGGMAALQAVKAGFPARAIVVVSTPSDWQSALAANPRLRDIPAQHWTGYDQDPAAQIERRSALRWVDRINSPVLIVHGADDATLKPDQALEFARALAASGKKYQLIVYAEDDHLVWRNHADRLRRAIEWFQRHQPPVRTTSATPSNMSTADSRLSPPSH